MRVKLSDNFTYGKLLRFVAPSVVMMVFTSLYSVVDGLFVSNYAGKDAFAAVNLIFPFIMVIGAIGFMIGSGGSALVSKILGEGDFDKANKVFTMLFYLTVAIGVVLSAVGIALLRPVAVLFGVSQETMELCITYGTILLAGNTLFMLQNVFQSFFVTAEKPTLGFFVVLAAGLLNAALDAVFVGAMKMGVIGAGIATVIGQVVGGVTPIIYFSCRNGSLLRFVRRCGWDFRAAVKTCTNGSSELMSNVAMSVVNMLYNFQLLRYVGEDGVSAYGFIMYVAFVFSAIFFGYSVGITPVVGYKYGAKDNAELKSVLKKSLVIISVCGALMTLSSFALSYPLAKWFVGYDSELFDLTLRGFRIYLLSFLIMGYNVFGSAFFTALSNGAVSALLSFVRTFVLQVVCVFVLPLLFGVDGVWSSIIFAELLSLALTVGFILGKRKRYGY